jgi:hypothetical protein
MGLRVSQMTRSRKKTPAGGMSTAETDKPYKLIEHRRERRQVNAALRHADEPPAKVYGNPWSAPKDGKRYFRDHDAKFLRK